MPGTYPYDQLNMGHEEEFDPQRLYDNEDSSLPRETNRVSPYSDKFTAVAPNDPELLPDAPPPELLYDTPAQPIPRWSPALLGILPMAAFGLILVLLIVGLEMLTSHSPYTAPSSGMQFFWTYFPVAILMVVEWVWGAYDLQVKVLVPWASMSRGFTPAHKGWLLDYIGANYFLSIWNAIRYRHVVVLLTTLGLWSTAITGVVTTSLFQIEDVAHTAPASFMRTTVLDPASTTAFSPSVLADKAYLSSYLGRQTLSLARPRWTTDDDIALEAFADPSSSSTNGTFVAKTQGYSADLSCTPASVSYAGNMTVSNTNSAIQGPTGYAFLFNITGAECSETYTLTDTNTATSLPVGAGLLWRVYNHTCTGSTNYTTVLFMVATPNIRDFSAGISAFAIECTPLYTQHTLAVSAPASSTFPISTPASRASPSVLYAPAWNGMLQWMSAINALPHGSHQTTFQTDPWHTWPNGAQMANHDCDCDSWFFLVGHGLNTSHIKLFDADVLFNASRAVFSGVWSDLAGSLLLTNADTNSVIAGEMTANVAQLVARQPSVRVAQTALAVLVLVTMIVWVLQPRAALPMDPSSIAAQAFLLHCSREEVTAAVRDTATMDSTAAQVVLEDCEFAVRNDRDFVIQTKWRREKPEKSVMPPSAAPELEWRPAILHPVLKGVLGGIILATIIALELALRRSIANDGFADHNSTGENWWTYLAPAYLFFLGIFISSYAFSISSLEPFFAMSVSPQPARQSVRYSPAHRTSVGLVFHALRYQSLVGLSCAAIMLIVPFVKIAVSGLVGTAAGPVQTTTQIRLNTTFNTTMTTPIFEVESTMDAVLYDYSPGQTLALAQIPKYQLPLPAWTTPVGAVGQVDLGELGALTTTPNTTVTIPLPVMRGDLENCTALTVDNLKLLPSNQLQLPLPPVVTQDGLPVCALNGESDFDSGMVNVSISLPSSPGWFGMLYYPTCGAYVIIYGKTQAANASVIDKITAVQCESWSLTMSTQNVTLSYTSQNVDILSINPAKQDTMTVLDGAELGFGGPGIPLPDPSYEANSSLSFDTFTQILTLHDTSTPLDAYLDAPTLTSAAQELFTAYWSILATLHLIIPANTTSSEPLPAVVNHTRTRIVQAVVPTRILQALLGCVLAFGLLTVITVGKAAGVLTKPPYAIGATMELLADSAFVELEGLQRVRREADLDVLLEPYLFRLGWGSNTQGGSRFGVDLVPP
ncbi:hypothetical protein B0H10DRAFT_2230542 [Mycena sp. CBHHK59/15]|nr:hypothetical protein B0H10DRAFT_2230542 [Mycena sp. CBHHK59/15]